MDDSSEDGCFSDLATEFHNYIESASKDVMRDWKMSLCAHPLGLFNHQPPLKLYIKP